MMQTPQKGGNTAGNGGEQGTFGFKVEPVKIKSEKDDMCFRNVVVYGQFNMFSREELRMKDLMLKKGGMNQGTIGTIGNQGNMLGFGAPQKPSNSGGLFGGATTVTTSPFNTGVGQPQQSLGLFSGNNTTSTNTSNTMGIKPAVTSASLFGGGIGTNTMGGGTSIFGGNNTSSQPATGGTGLFGGNITSQPSTNTLFGNNMTSQATTGTSLFGAVTQPSTNTSLFGNATNSLFSNANKTQQQQSSIFNNPSSQPISQAQTQAQPTTQAQGQFPMADLVQPPQLGIDINKMPSVVIEAFQQQNSLRRFKQDLESKYNQEILGSLLYNSSSSSSFSTEDTPEYISSYLKAKYQSNHPQQSNSHRTHSDKAKRTQMRQSFLNRLNMTSHKPLNASMSSLLNHKDRQGPEVIPSLFLGLYYYGRARLRFNDKEMVIPLPNEMTSIKQFKETIIAVVNENGTPIPSDAISLFMRNQFLNDEKLISDYNINDSCAIEVIVSSKPEGSNMNKHIASDEDIPRISLEKYSIDPDYKELCRMSHEELGHVPNVVISNEHGQIKFLQPVNMIGVNIDSIIQINPLQVSIYPGESPPKGREMNVPREITVKHIYLLTEEDIASVKEMIEQGEGRFASYDEATGVLVFTQ